MAPYLSPALHDINGEWAASPLDAGGSYTGERKGATGASDEPSAAVTGP